MTPNAVSIEAQQAIKDYCTKRNYKCRGCRYSIKYIKPDASPLSCCVFANCPCSWTVEREETWDTV